MNNYIIDPAVFYWINVFGILQTVLAVFGGLMVATGIGTTIGYIYNVYDIDEYSETTQVKMRRKANACKKVTIIMFCVGIPFILASIFIPSKTTCIEMLVARTATFDNVNWTVAQVKEVIDYIVSALKGAV